MSSRSLRLIGLFVLTPLAAVSVSSAADAPTAPRVRSAVPAKYQPALPKIPSATFLVTAHGAIGDGKTIATQSIQAAIDEARHAGGGTVEIPAGDFLCGPIELASGIALKLDAGATLRMLPLDRYPGGTSHPGDFISGANLHDIAITGSGTIDGQGEPWWPFAKKKGTRRPRMIALSACERILIEDVTLKNSPMFHIAIGGDSSDVTVRGVTIRAPASTDPVTPSHNTDACDVGGHNVLIQDCDVSVGDDDFTTGSNTHDVLITHCTYGYGHGVSIGSYTKGGVWNIAVVDCTFDHTECGIRIKSDRDRGGEVHHLVYENLRMTDVDCPILIYGAYMAEKREYRNLNALTPAIAATYPAAERQQRTPIYRDIVFRNLTATATPGRRAGLIWGLPEAPASDILLENVAITADLPFGIYFAERVKVVHSTIKTREGINQLATTHAEVAIVP